MDDAFVAMFSASLSSFALFPLHILDLMMEGSKVGIGHHTRGRVGIAWTVRNIGSWPV